MTEKEGGSDVGKLTRPQFRKATTGGCRGEMVLLQRGRGSRDAAGAAQGAEGARAASAFS